MVKGVLLKLFQGLTPYSISSGFRRDIHTNRRTAVAGIEVEEIEATGGCIGDW